MTDTSTQAVEAFAGSLSVNGTLSEEVAAELLLALAAERDELVKAAIMQKAACEGVSSMLLSVQKDCIAARRTALEDAAKVCDAVHAFPFSEPESSFVRGYLKAGDDLADATAH